MTPTDYFRTLPTEALLKVENLPYPKVASGKVREIFDIGDDYLMVATDRLSAFDVVFSEGIPGKGILLTQISLHWFMTVSSIIDHHLVKDHDERVQKFCEDYPQLQGRSMIVRKLKPLPIEAVVRGYLSGSGWKSYRDSGKLFGLDMPAGLKESDRLPEPQFTPTTKAQSGHDIPISGKDAASLIGKSVFDKVCDYSLELYRMGVERAQSSDLILADTKFEFGLDEDGVLYLIDEVLTPDSSRYWPRSSYAPGKPQPSFDKQFVRDYLESIDWDKKPPAPELPNAVITGTQERYLQAYERIVGAE
jgi:phosphoribosylaminoimidazole-succinocarboxamide synthase